MQRAPPGNPLFGFGRRLRGVGAGSARVCEHATPPLALIRNPLIANMIERARTIRFEGLMILTKIESRASARRFRIELAVPHNLLTVGFAH